MSSNDDSRESKEGNDEGMMASSQHPRHSNKRMKDTTVYKPIVVGTMSAPQGKKGQKDPQFMQVHGLKRRWCCYVRGANNEDISYFVKSVTFTLHETFKNYVRTVERPPFEVQEQGWGEFEIGIKIQFVDSSEKPVELHHQLKLFHDDKSSSQPSKRPLVSEQYDEIVFAHPTVPRSVTSRKTSTKYSPMAPPAPPSRPFPNPPSRMRRAKAPPSPLTPPSRCRSQERSPRHKTNRGPGSLRTRSCFQRD